MSLLDALLDAAVFICSSQRCMRSLKNPLDSSAAGTVKLQRTSKSGCLAVLRLPASTTASCVFQC